VLAMSIVTVRYMESGNRPRILPSTTYERLKS
jgi:hypothetical protein